MTSGGEVARAEREALNRNGDLSRGARREPESGSAAAAAGRVCRVLQAPHAGVATDPLRLSLVAAGAGELAAGARGIEAVKLIHGGALVAAARRPSWRVPLVTVTLALRAVELLRRRPTAPGLVWIAALAGLRHEVARAESWGTIRR